MKIKVKRLDDTLKNVGYAKEGDAGFDLYTREEITLEPMVQKIVPTGVALEIPVGYVGLVWDKSSIAIKNGLKVLGGVIDSGYRGEVMVGMINLGSEPYTFSKGEKVAQMIIQKFEHAEFEITETLSDSHRGDTGFGSSGK